MATKQHNRTTIHCDKCDKELHTNSGHGGQCRFFTEENWTHPHNGDDCTSTRETLDLCTDCGKLVTQFIKADFSGVFNAAGTTFIVLKGTHHGF